VTESDLCIVYLSDMNVGLGSWFEFCTAPKTMGKGPTMDSSKNKKVFMNT